MRLSFLGVFATFVGVIVSILATVALTLLTIVLSMDLSSYIKSVALILGMVCSFWLAGKVWDRSLVFMEKQSSHAECARRATRRPNRR